MKKTNVLPNLLVFTMFRKPKNNADKIHRAYAIYYWRKCRNLRDKMLFITSFIFSPVFIIRDIVKWSRKIGRKSFVKEEKPLYLQLVEQFYLAFFYSIDSENYYLQGFFRRDGLRRAKHFVNKGALKHGIYKLLATYRRYDIKQDKKCNLGNKVEFASYCLKNSIPVVPVFMEFLSDGTTLYHYSSVKELPKESIFCKPNIANEGKGAEIWYWDSSDNKYYNLAGRKISQEALANELISKAEQSSSSMLVQPLVLPHLELKCFRKNATPTIRILSHLNSKGKVKIDIGMLRFSTDSQSVVDNASAGGMVAPIEMKGGVIGPAIHSNIEASDTPLAKIDGVTIEGITIPFWKETLKLVKKAHKLFPDRVLIGWDILVTNSGPVILEANSQPGICFIQRAHGKSIGETKLGKSLAFHSTKALDVLYDGFIGSGTINKGSIKLFKGSILKKTVLEFAFPRKRTIKVNIYGKVQRVGYRKWFEKKARTLKISGWVKNLPDSSVEAVIRGRAADIEDMVKSCYLGPPNAKVESVFVQNSIDSTSEEFKVVY